MSKNLYEAAAMQLKARALEAFAALELLLKNPAGIPDHLNLLDEIVKHAKTLAENERAMLTLQQYFANHFEPPKAQPPGPGETPKVVTPEMSPTYKQQLQRQKMMEAARARRAEIAKKELYPETEEKSGLKEVEPKKKRRSRKKAEDNAPNVE